MLAETSFDRGADAAGSGRQLAAIQSGGSRARELRRIKAPTLVIHGKADLLVRPSGGRATARAIPNARLQLIEGMGHDLPEQLWLQVTSATCKTSGPPYSVYVTAFTNESLRLRDPPDWDAGITRRQAWTPRPRSGRCRR